MRRLGASVVACGAAGVACFGIAPTAAAANTTVEAGWWTATNPGSILGSPTPPPPPDVPEGGLLVEGGDQSAPGKANSDPTALAAVVFQLSPGATAQRLTLSVAPNSATTPTSTLELCPLANPALPVEYGGPMSDAPAYNCARNVDAGPSSDGTHYTFNVASLPTDDAFAVAILPTSPVDRVALSAPKETSLTVRLSPIATGSGGSSGAGPATSGSGGPSTGAGSAAPPSASAPGSSGTLPPVAPTTTSPPSEQQTPQVATAPESNYQPTGISAASRVTPPPAKPHTVIVVLAVLVLGVVLWQIVGRAAVETALRS